MHEWLGVDWGKLFLPDTPLLEILVRASILYLLLFLVVRFTPNRQMGGMAIADLLVVVLIANAAQNAMGGNYKSVTDGVFLILTLVGWSVFFNYLAHRFPAARGLLRPPASVLIKDGKLLRRNMRRELVIEEELMSQLRMQGIETLNEVKEARMEADGRISVIGRGAESRQPPERVKAS